MQPRHRILPVLIAATLVVACAPSPTKPAVKPSSKATTGPVANGATISAKELLLAVYGEDAAHPKGTAVAGVVKLPPALLKNNGAGIVTDNGSGVLSDNAGSIVTDNGSGLIANHGAGYRLKDVAAQVPLASARVVVVDAAGKPVTGADGKTIATQTDAKGHYAFAPGVVPPGNLRVQVDLAAAGTLEAMVPQGDDKPAVDVDVVSSLTTGYITGKFVEGQATPQATYNRLPRPLEEAARQAAADALAAAPEATPAQLVPGQIVDAVEGLRAKAQALDAKLATVKRVLIAAGQADLGDGRKGTDVVLSAVTGIASAPDGSLYINARGDLRVWKLLPDGTIKAWAGSGSTKEQAIEGVPGPQAPLNSAAGLAVDGQGRVVLAERRPTDGDSTKIRLIRVNADGTLHELWTSPQAGDFAGMSFDGDTLYAAMLVNQVYTLFQIPPDGPATQKAGFPSPGDTPMASFFALPNGKFYAHRFDPFGKNPGADLLDGPAGQIHHTNNLDVSPIVAAENTFKHARLEIDGANGASFAEEENVVYDGASRRLAGGGQVLFGSADALPLADPAGLGVLPGGDFVVADEEGKALIRIGLDGSATKLITKTALVFPSVVRADAAGNLYVLEQYFTDVMRIRQIAPDGTEKNFYEGKTTIAPPNADGAQFLRPDDTTDIPRDFVLAPDGNAYLAVAHQTLGNVTTKIIKRSPDGKETTLLSGTGDGAALGMDRRGILYVLFDQGGDGTLWMVSPDDKVAKAVQKDYFTSSDRAAAIGLAVDLRGRAYITNAGDDTIYRYDPLTDLTTSVAGKGTKLLAGSGTDDGIRNPSHPTFDLQGNLIFSDNGHRQVKRIPAADL